jgi:hypothetical protein
MNSVKNINIFIAESPGKGRGVFAARKIQKDEIIEECPCLTFYEGEEAAHIDRTPLGCYYFRWNEGINAILFGYGSLYNHSYRPNALYRRNYEKLTMDFVALRDIETGEEITINYNGKPDSMDPLWFRCPDEHDLGKAS